MKLYGDSLIVNILVKIDYIGFYGERLVAEGRIVAYIRYTEIYFAVNISPCGIYSSVLNNQAIDFIRIYQPFVCCFYSAAIYCVSDSCA